MNTENINTMVNTAMQQLIEFIETELGITPQREIILFKAIELRDTTERDQMISMAENAYWDIIGGGVINTTDQEQVRKDAENLFNELYKQ
jgi:hypothetical protein